MIPHLPSALTTHRLLSLLILLVVAKILSTATLIVLGDYRAARISPFRRLVLITSKATPPFVSLVAGLVEFSRGDSGVGWLFVAGSFLIAGFAAFVVALRNRGKFYGVADWIQRYLSPTQAKLALLAFLSVLFILALRVR